MRERDAVFLLLARSADEIAYAEELKASGLTVLVSLADGSEPPLDMHAAPAGGSALDGETLKALVADIADREVYVSGSPASVASLRSAARHAGAKKVHVDSFSGY